MNSSKILDSLKSIKRFYCLNKISKLQRNFLTEAYRSQLTWNKRFENKLLKSVDIDQLRFTLNDKIENKQIISALDVDIFVNNIEGADYLEDVANIIHKLRLTKETSKTLDSTHHAVIRYFINNEKSEDLINILNDRLNYGIFCDYFCYNLLMDYFINKQDFASASKVATLMMLQEEFENPISNSLAIYSCHNYLKNPDTWQNIDPETLKYEPVEEVKIRVKYLTNPYFDDHFDLWKSSDLVGKTLFWIGMTMDDPIGRSCHLRGLLLYKKYPEAIALLNTWKNNEKMDIIYKDVLSLIKKDVPEIYINDESTSLTELKQLLIDLESIDLYQANLDEDITNLVKKAIELHSEADILNQKKIYDDWHVIREKVFNEEIDKLERQKKLEKVQQLKENLATQERILTFFDNQDLIELEIDKKLKKEKLLYGEDPTTEHFKEYVPPELIDEKSNNL